MKRTHGLMVVRWISDFCNRGLVPSHLCQITNVNLEHVGCSLPGPRRWVAFFWISNEVITIYKILVNQFKNNCHLYKSKTLSTKENVQRLQRYACWLYWQQLWYERSCHLNLITSLIKHKLELIEREVSIESDIEWYHPY